METLLLGLIKLLFTIIFLVWIFEIVIWAFVAFALITIFIGYISAFIRGEKMIEFEEVIEFEEAKYEDNNARHTFPEHQGKGVDEDE